jgi:hypothetical protein
MFSHTQNSHEKESFGLFQNVSLYSRLYGEDAATAEFPQPQVYFFTTRNITLPLLQSVITLTFWHRIFTFNSNKSPT